jgi:hypothetical protein
LLILLLCASPPLSSIFVNNISPPFGTNDHKEQILDRLLCWIMGEGQIYGST